MLRFIAIAVSTLILGAPARAQERQPEPWGALVSPIAAMQVVFDKICLTAVREGRSIEQLSLDNHLRPVRPRTTGSPTATGAWRLASYSQVYAMALPDGACSASVEAGEADGLNAAALEILAAHGDFRPSAPEQVNGAERIAWCTSEAHPLVVVLLRKTGRRRHAFVANVFRARAERPSFCPAIRPPEARTPPPPVHTPDA